MSSSGTGKTHIVLALGHGDGTFAVPTLVEVTGSYRSSGGPFPVTTADVDGDGTVDVVLAASTGQVRVYNGVGDGTNEATPTPLPTTGVPSHIVARTPKGPGADHLRTATSPPP